MICIIPLIKMEELVKQITRYQKGSSQIREKLSKLKAAHRKVTQSIRVHEVLSVTSAKDANEGMFTSLSTVSTSFLTIWNAYFQLKKN